VVNVDFKNKFCIDKFSVKGIQFTSFSLLNILSPSGGESQNHRITEW